jgi:hypothetical protein
VGNIGILGINKNGEEVYQLMLGGHDSDSACWDSWSNPCDVSLLPASAESSLGTGGSLGSDSSSLPSKRSPAPVSTRREPGMTTAKSEGTFLGA